MGFPFAPPQGLSQVVGTATAAQVLTGYTFSSAAAGVGVAGTMPNQGALNEPPNAGGRFPGGYYTGITIAGWFTVANDTATGNSLAGAYDSSANLTYAIDGWNGSSYLATVTAYSHASNTWTAEASDTTARNGPASAYDSSANLTYAIDGYNGSSYLATVTAYVA